MKSDQIMIERTAASVVRSPIKPTAIKTILFHVHNDDQLQDRLQVALTLCRAFGAHLHLLHVVPLQAYTVVAPYSPRVAVTWSASGEKTSASTVPPRLRALLSNSSPMGTTLPSRTSVKTQIFPAMAQITFWVAR